MEPSAPPGEVLQLRAILRGIRPLIWRRLRVHRDTCIAHLHHILQVAFGWEDMHLHRFEIRGRAYGIPLVGGFWFSTDAHRTRVVQTGVDLISVSKVTVRFPSNGAGL